jgi:hypothetical protein
MEKLTNITLVSSKIEVVYLGTDGEGATAEHTLTLEPDTAWAALLCRYLKDHEQKGQHGSGGMKLSMIGSAGDRPGITEARWNPNRAFTG